MENIDTGGDDAALTSEQIHGLAAAIQDDFGVNLSRIDFCDKLLLTLEDVPGCESSNVATALIDAAWAEYRLYQQDV